MVVVQTILSLLIRTESPSLSQSHIQMCISLAPFKPYIRSTVEMLHCNFGERTLTDISSPFLLHTLFKCVFPLAGSLACDCMLDAVSLALNSQMDWASQQVIQLRYGWPDHFLSSFCTIRSEFARLACSWFHFVNQHFSLSVRWTVLRNSLGICSLDCPHLDDIARFARNPLSWLSSRGRWLTQFARNPPHHTRLSVVRPTWLFGVLTCTLLTL